jgi:nucleoside-diphosphate-sugar epimerase
MKVLVAGATGAVGRRLVPQLVERGHEVVGTTTRPEKFDLLHALGADAVHMDGLDAVEVQDVVAATKPDAIVHQMTALAAGRDLKHFDRVFALTNRLRTEGTRHLLAAATASGVDRFVVQSYCGGWNTRGATEDVPLADDAVPTQRESLAAIKELESLARGRGAVLRYGNLYGPGASEVFVELVRKRGIPVIGDGAGVSSWLHVDDAASAAVAAIERGARGIFNIVDDEPAPVSEWLPALAAAVGARPPRRLPVWLARPLAGEAVVRMMTEGRGASNAKAKRELGWQPRWPSWRDGFVRGLGDREALAA